MAPRKPMNRKLAVRRRVYKNPYLNFMEDFREEVRCRNLKPNQIFEEAGRRWREMTDLQRQPYREVALSAPMMRRPRKQSFGPKISGSKNYRGVRYIRNPAAKAARVSETTSCVSEPSRTSLTSFVSSEV